MTPLIIAIGVIVVAVLIYLFIVRPRATARSGGQGRFSEEEYNQHYEAKKAGLERVLGPMHDLVGHAIIPFQVGGAVDMYYFPHGISGTGFATMELIEPDGSGPKPNRIGTYELVAFTKQSLPSMLDRSADDPFNTIEGRIRGIFTMIGNYSRQAVLNPGDTIEAPGAEGEPNHCLIFDEYAPDGTAFEVAGKRHCLLLCLQVFRSEMEYAMQHGSAEVLRKLKESGYYPYSDLDREPVY